MPTSYVVIPARLASTRLPRKLLLDETGQTVIEHTYRAAATAQLPSGIIVAADDEQIVHAVEGFGGQACLTRIDHQSGSDRVAEVARELPGVEIIVNVQGDEPEISGASIDRVIALLAARPGSVMATLATPIRTRANLLDPACVKVVCDGQGRARYFSRAAIPFAREWDDELLTADPPNYLQHVGIYAYRRDFLLEWTTWPQSRTEQIEKLEQLRVLDAGCQIEVGLVASHARGIDTPADYNAFVARQRRLQVAA